jgi:hypothetical protein
VHLKPAPALACHDARSALACQLSRQVSARCVNDDHLNTSTHTPYSLKHRADGTLFIERRNDDGDGRALGWLC